MDIFRIENHSSSDKSTFEYPLQTARPAAQHWTRKTLIGEHAYFEPDCLPLMTGIRLTSSAWSQESAL